MKAYLMVRLETRDQHPIPFVRDVAIYSESPRTITHAMHREQTTWWSACAHALLPTSNSNYRSNNSNDHSTALDETLHDAPH